MPIISVDFENNNTALSNSIITSQNIENMDVVIDTGLVPVELFKENDAPNSCPIIIPVPSDNALLQISTVNQTPDVDYILPDIDNYFLPAMELILENSINSDPEYTDPIKETEGGRKRNKSNKRKEKQIQKNKLPDNYILSCAHVEEVNKNSKSCSILKLTHKDIMTFKNNLCTLSSKVEQDKFVLTLMEVRKAKRTNQKKIYKN